MTGGNGNTVYEQRDEEEPQSMPTHTAFNPAVLSRLRSEHDQAIASLAENMNRHDRRLAAFHMRVRPSPGSSWACRWNEAVRDLSKEFHDFQKVPRLCQCCLALLWFLHRAGSVLVHVVAWAKSIRFSSPLRWPAASPSSGKHDFRNEC